MYNLEDESNPSTNVSSTSSDEPLISKDTDEYNINAAKGLDRNRDQSGEGSAPTETKTYWYRWYICFIFGSMAMLQNAIWNTWSPIDESAECALGFTPENIDLLANWGPIIFLPTMPFFMWLLDKKGLRISVVLTAFLMALGTGLRCLPLPVPTLRYFIHAGQILNAIAGCVSMAAPPQISNVWFPVNERITATSVSTLLSFLGTALPFVIAPVIIQPPSSNNTHQNITANDAYGIENELLFTKCNDTKENEVMRKQIMEFMYLEFGIVTAVFLALLGFFPNKPPSPPSITATTGRLDFKKGLLALFRKRTYVVVSLSMAVTVGGYGSWSGDLSIVLSPLHVTQNQSDKLGLFMTLAGCFIGMLMGWFADRLKGRVKLIIVTMLSVGLLALLYYISMTQKWIKNELFLFSEDISSSACSDTAGLWTSCLIIGVVTNAVAPLGMEMAADAAYPVSEAIAASVLVWLLNLATFILLLVLQVTNAVVSNYILFSFIVFAILIMIFFAQERLNRMQIDSSPTKEDKKSLLGPSTSQPII